MKRVDVYLPDKVCDALRLEARKRRQSVSSLGRQWVHERFFGGKRKGIMRRLTILQKEREALVQRLKRMTPEERLTAYARHSQLMHRMYQAGVKHRAGRVPSSKRKSPKSR